MARMIGRPGERGRAGEAFYTQILFMLAIFLVLLPFAAQAQFAQELETDAVYLLDVTSSMVGCNGKDILNQVIDLLLADIERFRKGRLILITFANGSYDLDGPGPIQDRYEQYIATEQDKLFLKQFLRPDVYGSFPEDPQWKGVYAAVERSSKAAGICLPVGIGPTGVYTTVLKGLDILEQLQKDGGDQYAATHVQELFVYTDGRDNAPGSPGFNAVVKKLSERHFRMLERFRYKRYLFSGNRADVEAAEQECATIERAGAAVFAQNVVAPDVRQLVVIDFDRSILGFSENLWAPVASDEVRTVTLRNIHLYYDQAKVSLVEGGRLVLQPIRSEDLGLPGDIAVRARTEPADLIFPLQRFDLSLSFEPFSRLEQYMNRARLEKLTGTLRFVFLSPGEKEAPVPVGRACEMEAKGKVIDVRRASLPVELIFKRPELTASVKRTGENQLRIDLIPNSVLASLPPNQRSVSLQVLPADYLEGLRDEGGIPVARGQPIVLPTRPLTIFATISGDVPCGKSVEVEVRLTAIVPLASWVINGEVQSTVSFYYHLQGISLDPQLLVSENLWTPKRWGNRTAEPATIPFTLSLCTASQGKIHILAREFNVPAHVRVEPESLDLKEEGEHRLQLQLIIQPQQDWEALAEVLKQDGPHGLLQVRYEALRDDTLIPTLKPTPITLRYMPQYVLARVEPLLEEKATPGAVAYRLGIEAIGVPSGQTLLTLEGPQVWRIRRSGTLQVSTLTEKLPLAAGEYELQLDPNLPRSTQQGTLSLRTQGTWPLLVQLGYQEIRRPEGQYDLSYLIQVEDLLALVSCESISKELRWRRGQVLLRCTPHVKGATQDQVGRLELIPRCDPGLIVRTGPFERRCGTPMAIEAFEIAIAPDAPPGTQVAQQLNRLETEVRYRDTQKSLDVELRKPQVRGYLLPRSYDQLWEQLLRGSLWLIWGIVGLALVSTVLYATLIQKENPLSFLIDHVWYDERWRWVAIGLLALGVFALVVRGALGWGLYLSYGA